MQRASQVYHQNANGVPLKDGEDALLENWAQDVDIVIDTSDVTPEEAVQQIILHLEREGYIAGE